MFFVLTKPRWNFLAEMQNVTFGENPTQHITQRTPSLLWSMVVAASCYRDVSHHQGLGHLSGKKGKWMLQNTEKSERKTCCPLQESWNWDGSSCFSTTTTRNTQPSTLEWLRNKKMNVLEWPSQNPDINPIKNLWHDLKIAAHQCSPLNLTEFEPFCTEEWANFAQTRCAKMVETYPNRLTAVIAVTGASTRFLLRGVGTYPTKIF